MPRVAWVAAVGAALAALVETPEVAPEPTGCGVAPGGAHWVLLVATATTAAALATRVAVPTVNMRPPRRVTGVGKAGKRRVRRRAISRRIAGRASGSTSTASARACNA